MTPNNTQSLDLYASVEDMLGVLETAPKLYAHYLLALQDIAPKSLLDVGCGSGTFIASIQNHFPDASFKAIDLSPQMVTKAREAGIDAECIEICDVEGTYDTITATFDVLNYLSQKELEGFLKCIKSKLNPDGYFLCDINTEFGLSELAVGNFIADWDDRYLTIESDYDDGLYTSDFTLFTKQDKAFTKQTQTIHQYLHTTAQIQVLSALTLERKKEISLYEQESDKLFLIFKN